MFHDRTDAALQLAQVLKGRAFREARRSRRRDVTTCGRFSRARKGLRLKVQGHDLTVRPYALGGGDRQAPRAASHVEHAPDLPQTPTKRAVKLICYGAIPEP